MISNKRLIAKNALGIITIKRGNGIWSSTVQKAPYEIHKFWTKSWLTRLKQKKKRKFCYFILKANKQNKCISSYLNNHQFETNRMNK